MLFLQFWLHEEYQFHTKSHTYEIFSKNIYVRNIKYHKQKLLNLNFISWNHVYITLKFIRLLKK